MLVISRTYFIPSLALAASLRVLKQTYAQPRGGIICYYTRHRNNTVL